MKRITFLLAGTLFGFVLTKAEVVSWYRIFEMFRFESFHMYGIIGVAVTTAALSVALIKKFNIRTVQGEEINLNRKPSEYKAHLFGGIIFGLGWALTGSCPGPVYALLGSGYFAMIVTLVSALAGVYVYALIKDKLPH